jgi:hypothetical protein
MFISDPKFFLFRIPDPNFFHPGSRNRIKEFQYFNPKSYFLSSRKYDPGCSSRIQGSKKHRIPDPQHCILCTHSQVSFNIMRAGSLGNMPCFWMSRGSLGRRILTLGRGPPWTRPACLGHLFLQHKFCFTLWGYARTADSTAALLQVHKNILESRKNLEFSRCGGMRRQKFHDYDFHKRGEISTGFICLLVFTFS